MALNFPDSASTAATPVVKAGFTSTADSDINPLHRIFEATKKKPPVVQRVPGPKKRKQPDLLTREQLRSMLLTRACRAACAR